MVETSRLTHEHQPEDTEVKDGRRKRQGIDGSIACIKQWQVLVIVEQVAKF